ncbi:uncharacterized protein LODBEIA_P32460 [Lodderomyces beijingensis]|uniref:Uncharacterized protein n=1 Tax=Lodderomyces beijingensis TaxID=1775926 RepID=A0ABP0ZNV3_9ASCO
MLIEEVPEVDTLKDVAKIVKSLSDLGQPPSRYHGDLLAIESAKIINYDVVKAISLHANPNLSWCSEANAQIVSSIIQSNNLQSYLTQFLNQEFRSNLKKVEKQAKSGLGGRRSGLRPKLTFQDQTFDPVPLAQAWFLIEVTKNKDREVNMLILLLLIDDFYFDTWGKIETCKVLQKLKLDTLNSLVPQLRESLSKCLLHIPPVTPEDESLSLLQVAYPSLYRVDDEFGTNLNYIETIATIMSSMSYAANFEKTMCFLLEQLSICIKRIGVDVLISVSKIFYLLNQLITNIAMMERCKVILAALRAQNEILQLESPLLYSFIFDLVGAYALLTKRVEKYKVADIQEQISVNRGSLRQLAVSCGKLSEFDELCTYIQ